ncbi:zinc finger protein 93-like [Ruditapes philippinarum]|uniref:zinc finger protein 93-like n=1 Tax=Ruditapes philippinarum TaxID=129788 RepID=UPI00295BF6EA|nr:zinc finger protein 93-like [Ruditapes philippinarum]
MYKKMPDNFICGKCGKVAKTKQALERHAAYHEDDRPFSCEVCLQRFKNSDDRGKHYRRLKRDGKFNIACTVCHKHFKTDDILRKHIEMLGCNVAAVDGTVTSKSEPTGHNIQEGSAITLKEEYVIGDCIACTCKVCENVFSSTSSLKKHYKEVHNDNKRQVCIQCGQTLSSKDSLARHFSIFHQSSFPYACDLCDQKFKIKESLCRHVKFVHQDGGYQCHECHRVFSQPVNLRKHSAVHTTQKQFTCKSCGREFRWKQAMQKHELLHDPQGLSSKEDKKVNSSNCIKEDLNGPGERIGETHIDLEDDETLDNSYEVFNDIHSNTDSPNDSAQGNVIEDKTRCELNSANQSIKVKGINNSVKSSVKKLPTLPDSSEYSSGNNDTVKKGRESRWSEGDEYDFPDSDDESGFNDNFSREECRKRVGFSNVMKCIKSKKLKLVDINTRPKEKTFSRVPR